jgi:large subunit ribosomal protein L21
MSYAVIRTGGKQYKVNEGDTVRIDLLSGKAGDKVTFDDVLAIGGGDEPKIAKGKLAGASVDAEIVGEVKGDKLVVFKFRRRKRSRKKNGHRQLYTAVKILKVNG